MAQLPQINRELLSTIFRSPDAVRAYEELQRRLATTPDDVDSVTVLAADAQFRSAAALQRSSQALALASRSVRAGFGLAATADAAGVTFDVSPESLILALLPFLPRPPAPIMPVAVNDAQHILANRIFGAR